MRIAVVSAQPGSWVYETLSDLGAAVRHASALAPPEELVGDAELLVLDTPDDGGLAGFLVRRVREHGSDVALLVALSPTQLTRLEPSWGHDDFVVTPCAPSELYARVRALEWRRSAFAQPERIKVGALVLDPGAHVAQLAGRPLTLARREFELLTYLARAAGKVVRREQLLQRVWGLRAGAETRTLDVHVRRLRALLGATVAIETVRGVGYRLQG